MSNVAYKDECGPIHVTEHSDALPPIHTIRDRERPYTPSLREIANHRLAWMYSEYLTVFPHSKLHEIFMGRFGVYDSRLVTVEQLTDLIEHFRSVLLTVPRRSA